MGVVRAATHCQSFALPPLSRSKKNTAASKLGPVAITAHSSSTCTLLQLQKQAAQLCTTFLQQQQQSALQTTTAFCRHKAGPQRPRPVALADVSVVADNLTKTGADTIILTFQEQPS